MIGKRLRAYLRVGPTGALLLLALAEENYDNRPRENPQAFARRIQLFAINARCTLLDVLPDIRSRADGGRIAGWVYPVH